MKRVLVIREGALGDLILTFPVFLSLKNNGYEVFVAGNGLYKEFVKKYGNVDDFFSLDSSEFLFLFEGDKEKIRGFLEKFDLIIAYCRKDEILGENLSLYEKSEKVIFHPVRRENLKIHIIDYLLIPLKRIGFKTQDNFRLKIDNNEEFFVIHPGSGNKKKNWPKEKFLKLAEKLENVKIILGPAEQNEIDFWRVNFNGEIILNPEIEEILKIAEKTNVYIGNDSGITHLFSITGVKTIGIFGPTSPFIWGPRGENVIILFKDVGCNPCNYEKMIECKKRVCLEKIEIQDILNLIKEKEK